MVGTKISNYKILQKIGEGGMGTVYLAKHTALERYAAVKVLLPEYTHNSEIRDRFINEAKALSKLSHNNIVTVYDFEENEGNFCIIMEYIDGVSLDKYIIAQAGKISEEFAIGIFSQILDGFEYAHSKGIIHRDIKPSNIILNTENVPKILDFGIAKIVQGDISKTKTGTRMGSVLYMSPEQILGRDVDKRTDIYSLGITLYELLAGKNPYDSTSKSEYEIQNDVLNMQVPLSIIKVSDRMKQIINTATSKNAGERFESCKDFKKVLYDVNYIPFNQSRTAFDSSFKKYSNSFEKKTIYQEHSGINIPQNTVKKSNTVLYLLIALIVIIITGAVFYVITNKDPEIIVAKPDIKVSGENTHSTTDSNNISNQTLEETIVKNTLNEMLNAWQNKDIDGFFRNLSSDYEYKSAEGIYRTYSTRKSKAYEIFANNSFISITPFDMTVSVNGTEALVRFRQKYNSTTMNETTIKKFYLRKRNNVWLVYRELSGFN